MLIQIQDSRVFMYILYLTSVLFPCDEKFSSQLIAVNIVIHLLLPRAHTHQPQSSNTNKISNVVTRSLCFHHHIRHMQSNLAHTPISSTQFLPFSQRYPLFWFWLPFFLT